MSDSPIFDMIDRERSYTEKMAETKKMLARHTGPLFVRVVPAPDEEEEVFVRPFVKTEEKSRGTHSTCTDRCDGQHGIRGLLEHVGIDTSRGISVGDRVVAEPAPGLLFGKSTEGKLEPQKQLIAKVFGVPAELVQDQISQYEPSPITDATKGPETFRQAVDGLVKQSGIELTAKALEPVIEPLYEPVREETEFDPLELSEKGTYFTDFAMDTIAKFRKTNPDVERINFFIDPEKSFTSPTETFVIEGRRPAKKIQNPDEVMARPLPGIQQDEYLPEFGVQLIGAQDVPEDVLAAYRAAVAQQYPGCMPMAITAIQEHKDGSATVTMEGQDFSTRMPSSWIKEEDLADDADTTEFEKRTLEYFGKKPWESDKSLSRKMRTTE